MIYITNINYKKKILKKLDYIIWNVVWLLIIFLSVRPKFIDEYIINNYQLDFFYIANILSILILIIIYFLSLVKIRILEKKIDIIIRAESLKKIIKKIKE
jgi:hypothetical protein